MLRRITSLVVLIYCVLTLAAPALGRAYAGIGVLAYTESLMVNGYWVLRPDIFVQDVERGLALNWTRTPDINEESPIWSPDGSRLAYRIGQIDSPVGRICVIGFGDGPDCYGFDRAFYSIPVWLDDGHLLGYSLTRIDAVGQRSSESYRVDLETRSITPVSAIDPYTYSTGEMRSEAPTVYRLPAPDPRWEVEVQYLYARYAILILHDLAHPEQPPRRLTHLDVDAYYPVWRPAQ